jgi:hypothetical protein
VEELADPHGQLEARGVIPPLEKPYRLVVDGESVGELLAREASVSTQDGKPVVDARGGLVRVTLRSCQVKLIVAYRQYFVKSP